MSQDYIALEWVRGEIRDTLHQAQRALEDYAENTHDQSRLRFCLSYVHQVHGTLQMLEFYGAALLAEEMEAVALALTEGALSNEQDGLEVLMQAIIQLPHYLEHVKIGRRDLPVVLLPILNELRSIRGENFLSETSLFSPAIKHNEPLTAEFKQQFARGDFNQWLRKTRQMLQVSTLQLLQNHDVDLAKSYINKIFSRLNRALGGTPQGIVWLPALAFSEWLAKQNALPKSAKVLLRQLDQLLKTSVDQGIAAINRPPSNELLKNLLFYVARTDAKGEAIRLVQSRFELANALPTAEELLQGKDGLGGGDNEAMGSAVIALIEEITTIKERLDQLMRDSGERKPVLSAIVTPVNQLNDTMGMLGLGLPRQILLEQAQQIQSLLNADLVTDADLLDIAGALLYVEATLSGMLRDNSFSGAGSDVSRSDAHLAVLRETRNTLEQVKDAVVAYISNQWATNYLTDVPEQLHSVAGSLGMIPLPRLAQIMQQLSEYSVTLIAQSSSVPEWADMDRVAEILSAVDYYIERYSSDAHDADDSLIDRAELALLHLFKQHDLSETPKKTTESIKHPLENTPSDSLMSSDDYVVDEIDYEDIQSNDLEKLSVSDDDFSANSLVENNAYEADAIDNTNEEIELTVASESDSESNNEYDDLITDDLITDDLITDDIIEIFLEEAEEVRETLQQAWPNYQNSVDDLESLTTIRRSFHTLKGSGRMVHADSISELAWATENMLNRVLDETITVNDHVIQLCDDVISALPQLIDDFRHQRATQIDTASFIQTAMELSSGNIPDAPIPDLTTQDSTILDSATEPSSEVIPEEVEQQNYNPERVALLDIFINEAKTHLGVVQNFVSDSRDSHYYSAIPDELQRALHTLKGSAHMAGVAALANIASPLEKLVKEYRANDVSNSAELTQLVDDGHNIILQSLTIEQLYPNDDLPESESLITRIELLLASQITALNNQISNEFNRDTLIAMFMREMDSILDADQLVDAWQHGQSVQVFDPLISDLNELNESAQKAQMTVVAELASASAAFYQRLQQQSFMADDENVALAHYANESLLGLMDCVAVGQDLADVSGVITQLNVAPVVATNTFDNDFSEDTSSENISNVIDSDFQYQNDNATDHSQQHFQQESNDDASNDDDSGWAYSSAPSTNPDAALHDTAPSDTNLNHSELSHSELKNAELNEEALILDVFLEEAEEINEVVEELLQKWQTSPDDLLQIAQLQREVHTLKGGARMAELAPIADLCHELETLYELLNDGDIDLNSQMLPLIQRSHDTIADQLQAVRNNETPASAESLCAEIRQMLGNTNRTSNDTNSEDQTTANNEQGAYVPSHTDGFVSESVDQETREILSTFVSEAEELVDDLISASQEWHDDIGSQEYSNDVLTALELLGANARLADEVRISELAQGVEKNIRKAQDRDMRLDDAFFQHLNERIAEIGSQVEARRTLLAQAGVLVRGRNTLSIAPEASALEPAPTLNQNEQVSNNEGHSSQVISTNPNETQGSALDTVNESSVVVRRSQTALSRKKAPSELVKVSADLLDNLVNLAGETAIGRGRVEQNVTDFSYTLGEMDQTIDRLRDQLRRLDIETEAQVLFRQERHGPAYDDFDPLEMDRYSAIQQLSRSLMESASDLLDLKTTLSVKARDTETLLLQQSRINTELQEGLMKTRMVPFQRLVPRLRRIVRQVSIELDKQVELQVLNGDGEMDRTILERMISPLEHMMRNAVDHGIEAPALRRELGKPEIGNITLDVTRDGGEVVLLMRDDGAGIDLDVVLEKARSRGMVANDLHPHDNEILQFILQPGFSTADVVTQISGRGVGMDVVASEIKQMGGTLDIRSKVGEGTEFEARLPFTVAVNRALMVKLNDDLYAIPLNNIQGIVRVPVNELQQIYARPEDERVYQYNGVDYRLGYLGALLDDRAQPKVTQQQMPLPILLVRGPIPYAMHVDSLFGSREIVVKNLGPHFAVVRGVSGGTILGDGSVVVILDLPALVRTISSIEYQRARALESQQYAQSHANVTKAVTVMVVDDSVTVRKVTSRILERQGMEVITAKDGMDAMELLQGNLPDLILLDIEMPRMDGFEMAQLVRHDERLKAIPIIMITSRTGEKHRERAFSIGVNDYMGKPFQEDALLANIKRYVTAVTQ
ncbi:MAG: Hpt domain-containing protein [Oleibacter sp.]|nr:Hpt domain-containing protein [Thalassolituus sp.]